MQIHPKVSPSNEKQLTNCLLKGLLMPEAFLPLVEALVLHCSLSLFYNPLDVGHSKELFGCVSLIKGSTMDEGQPLHFNFRHTLHVHLFQSLHIRYTILHRLAGTNLTLPVFLLITTLKCHHKKSRFRVIALFICLPQFIFFRVLVLLTVTVDSHSEKDSYKTSRPSCSYLHLKVNTYIGKEHNKSVGWGVLLGRNMEEECFRLRSDSGSSVQNILV
ncbi:hypothetical protein CEXT_606971 [Caerostris extrusa]|uniref:Uncharacterized protein n=1 Tax=Caerostris extrusa TaxID=172846 RepID=A0AAV4UQ65_CAEEX|nr:hypothetical protein CEXT_606971 [Caerostris extrusa]